MGVRLGRIKRDYCAVEDCTAKLKYGQGTYCGPHYKSYHRYGDPSITRTARKGKGCIRPDGYRLLAHKLEHRRIMEAAIGRLLDYDECVHHKNGIKTDNRLSNLEIVSRAEHARQHTMERYHGKT